MVDSTAEFPRANEGSKEAERTPAHTASRRTQRPIHPITRHNRGSESRIFSAHQESATSERRAGRPDIKLDLYHGPGHEAVRRGMREYQDYFIRKGKEVIYIDDLFVNALKNAHDNGRKNVTIFDFGCGEGNMMRDLVNDPLLMQEVKKYPEIQIEIIGLTDSASLDNKPTEEEKRNGRPIELSEGTPSNISARIDFYAVSAARTMEQYFEKHNIRRLEDGGNGIDLVFAVQSLQYLPEKNFDEVMRSITDRLVPHGRMVAYNFSNPDPVDHIEIKSTDSSPKTRYRFHERFSDQAERLQTGSDDEVFEEISELQGALDHYREKGAITQAEIDYIFNRLVYELSSEGRKVYDKEISLVDQISIPPVNDPARRALVDVAFLLQDAEKRFVTSRYERRQKHKRETLNALNTKPGLIVTTDPESQLFDIVKEADSSE